MTPLCRSLVPITLYFGPTMRGIRCQRLQGHHVFIACHLLALRHRHCHWVLKKILIALVHIHLDGKCQRAIFQIILNLQFPKLASPILTVATPLNAKPPTPLYFYPFMSNHTRKNKERYHHWRRLWYNYARYPYGIYSRVNQTSALA